MSIPSESGRIDGYLVKIWAAERQHRPAAQEGTTHPGKVKPDADGDDEQGAL